MGAQLAIVQQITEKHLPIFAHTAEAYRRALAEPVLNWRTLGDIILKDPGLVLQTLQCLKSASRRAASLEITDMSQAAMLLGMQRVKDLTRSLPVLEQSANANTISNYTKAVNRAFHAAYYARNWAQWRNDPAPEEVFIATLLHSAPELALWISAPETMQQLRRRIFREGMSADDAHHITLGQSLQHYGREASANLQLPPFLQDVFRPENAHLPRVQGVLLAVRMANTVEFGWNTKKVLRIIEQVAEHINKGVDDTISIIHQNAAIAARNSPFTSVRSAAAWLALIPSDDNTLILDEFPDQEVTSKSITKPVTAIKVTAQTLEPRAAEPRSSGSVSLIKSEPHPELLPTSEDEELETHSLVCINPQPAIFAKAVQDLEAGMGVLNATQIIRLALHGMHEGAAFHRVVFAAQATKRPYLEAKFMSGTDNDSAFNNFQIKLDNVNLFSRLLEKPSNLWINEDNRSKYWSLVPPEFKVLVRINSFCAMSVHVNAKPVGLFYADRHSIDCRIDKQGYTMFKHLGQLAARCLAARPKV